MPRKYRQCPKCKSKKGFRINYDIIGYGYECRKYDGEVFDADRSVVDNVEPYGVCLECGHQIEIEKLDYDK